MVQWNAEKDQILLKGIFSFCEVKSSAPLLAYLAQEIGGDCTPKAVSHRLNNIRKSGKPASTPGRGTPIKTPTSRGRKKKPVTPEPQSSADEEDPQGLRGGSDEEEEVVSPSMNRKRARSTPKKSYAESDQEDGEDDAHEGYVPFGKRIKPEPVEREEVFVEAEEELREEI